jgi:hypothetical protein
MLSRFLDTTAVDQFAAWVAAELQRRIPPDKVGSASSKAIALRRELDLRIAERAQRLLTESRPNLYQKAQLGARLQDQLQSRGYSGPFVRSFALDVVSLVANVPVAKAAK